MASVLSERVVARLERERMLRLARTWSRILEIMAMVVVAFGLVLAILVIHNESQLGFSGGRILVHVVGVVGSSLLTAGLFVFCALMLGLVRELVLKSMVGEKSLGDDALGELARANYDGEVLLICGNCSSSQIIDGSQRSIACNSCGMSMFTAQCPSCATRFVASDSRTTCPTCSAALVRSTTRSISFRETDPVDRSWSARNQRPCLLDRDDATPIATD